MFLFHQLSKNNDKEKRNFRLNDAQGLNFLGNLDYFFGTLMSSSETRGSLDESHRQYLLL